MVEDARLQGRPLLGEHRVVRRGVRSGRRRVQAEHPEVVCCLPLVELLLRGLADLRVREHEEARLRAVDARLPRSARARDVPVLGELGGVLTEVPDVALLVLAVPLGRALLEVAAQIQAILDHHARDTGDQLGPVRDGEHLARGVAVLRTAVHVRRAGNERVPGVVHARAEVSRPGQWRRRTLRSNCDRSGESYECEHGADESPGPTPAHHVK